MDPGFKEFSSLQGMGKKMWPNTLWQWTQRVLEAWKREWSLLPQKTTWERLHSGADLPWDSEDTAGETAQGWGQEREIGTHGRTRRVQVEKVRSHSSFLGVTVKVNAPWLIGGSCKEAISLAHSVSSASLSFSQKGGNGWICFPKDGVSF